MTPPDFTTQHCTGEARPLVLASASPRRRELLYGLGLEFQTDVSDVPEPLDQDQDIRALVTELATAKAYAVSSRYPVSLIIAADTLVALGSRLFGKPRDRDEARDMLGALSGQRHRVATGLVLLDTASVTLDSRVVETDVYFRALAASEIEAYLSTPEPYDKAGAYGAQGLGSTFVSRIEGDYFNVVGLPLEALNQLLQASGCCVICRRLRALSVNGPT